MSSACRLRLAVLLSAAAAAACGSEARQAAVTQAPPIAHVPVGPLPGPAEDDGAAVENPFAENDEALAEGRRYFVWYNCAGCHGDHGGGGMGPSLRDAVWVYGASHANIARSIADGRANGMPAWGQMLTPAQIWQITAYLKSMRTNREPQRPAGGARVPTSTQQQR